MGLERRIIGDKEIFAIDYSVTNFKSPIIGNVQIWINNIPIGYFNDEVYLHYILTSLKNILEKDVKVNFDLAQKSDEKIFNILLQKSVAEEDKVIIYDKFIVQFGESFDDFIIRVINIGGGYKFLWKLVDEPCLNEYLGYNKGINSGVIPKEILLSVYSKFKSIF
jgi:hypothetical protein